MLTQKVANNYLVQTITVKLEVGSFIVLMWVCKISFNKYVNGSQKVKKEAKPLKAIYLGFTVLRWMCLREIHTWKNLRKFT